MKIKVLIVDDEPLLREKLKRVVSQDKDFEIVDEADNGKKALQKLEETKVDVVFLDIEMPGLNGLEVAAELANWEDPPWVVFVTAYNQYAINAFQTHAVDYVLKPYDPDRLKESLEHIKKLDYSKKSAKSKLQELEGDLAQQGLLTKILGRKRNSKERVIIDPSQVYYFYAHLKDVLAHLKGEELIVSATLKDLEKRLDAQRFIQTHRTYIVNLDKVEKLVPMFSGNYEIILKDAQPNIPLARRHAQDLKKQLKNW